MALPVVVMTSRVSLAELAAADIPLRPDEAVAIIAEICRQHSSGRLPGIPSAGVIRLTRDGAVVAEGPMTAGAAGVARAAHLLNELLPGFDAPAGYRARGALRLVIARALGTLDLPPYGSLQDFSAALGRFAVADLGKTARSLFLAWEQERERRSPSPPTLTISDIRRARRATGLSLDDMSRGAGVPAARLREIEWGYFLNWRADAEGRACVENYARAAGLDERVVLAIVWPMIEEAAAIVPLKEAQEAPETTLVPSRPPALVTIERAALRRRAKRASWGVAAVAAAILALATVAMTVEPSEARPPIQAEASTVPAAVSPRTPPVTPTPRASTRPAPAAARVRPASARAASTTEPRPATRPKGFFQRELFRIVIR